MLELNLPSFNYKLKKKDSALFIYDVVRRKFVALTPEEWVRQHFIHHLIIAHNVPKNLISVERTFNYNELKKRWDIVVWNNNGVPELLIECKAPSITLNNKVLFQSGTYNQQIKAAIVGVTNGMNHYYFRKVDNDWILVEELSIVI
jgi:hypothetical protein